jgi:hypothetical protein
MRLQTLVRLNVGPDPAGSAPCGQHFLGLDADRIGRRKAFIAAVLNVLLASEIMAVMPEQGGRMILAPVPCANLRSAAGVPHRVFTKNQPALANN